MFSSTDDTKNGPRIVWVFEDASSQNSDSPHTESTISKLDATAIASTMNTTFQLNNIPKETLSNNETKETESPDPSTKVLTYRFTGNFSELNKANDKQIFYADDSERFDGMLRNGKRNGYGTLSCSDGSGFAGEYRNDQPHGFGKRVYADGRRFEGTYKDGVRDGTGTMFFGSGREFNGSYVDDVAEGYGTYDDPIKGIAFRGAFKNGVAHGQGASSDGSGGWKIGEYIDGHRRGLFTWIRRNGDVSEFEEAK